MGQIVLAFLDFLTIVLPYVLHVLILVLDAQALRQHYAQPAQPLHTGHYRQMEVVHVMQVFMMMDHHQSVKHAFQNV